MDILRPHLPEDFCSLTADAILAWPRGTVILTTGFYVAGHPETDGPPGTLFLARALAQQGFSPVVATDPSCREYFEKMHIPVFCFEANCTDHVLLDFLKDQAPVGLISIERCGKNSDGIYANMRGVDISPYTAPLDRLFLLANCPTVGIGDGGNEIGMGNLASMIRRHLPLIPCAVCTDHLMIATVSNWGALALGGCLGYLPDEEAFLDAYRLCCDLGFVDGTIGQCVLQEDGFGMETGLHLLSQLKIHLPTIPVPDKFSVDNQSVCC